jgi:hypothetical protein
MDGKKNPEPRNYFKGLIKKAQGAINLVIGNSDVYSDEDKGGELRFDPAIMMKINVTFDKDFLPKEKVVKLNVRGSRFFYDIKRNVREITGIYIVYPQEYEFQFDVRREEWEKRLIEELNDEYQLTLKKIFFVSEDKVCRMYQRNGLTHIRNPYNLQPGELLIIAGGFANFDTRGLPLAEVNVDISAESKGKNGRSKIAKKSYTASYYDKYSRKSGAYFYIGGEWFHNLFVPELYHPEAPRFFSFRIADDGKSLKFFSDLKKRGIDILDDVKHNTGPDREEILHTINPEYFKETGIKNFKLSVIYDLKEEALQEEAGKEEATPVTAEKVPVREQEETDMQAAPLPEAEEETGTDTDEEVPYLESEMILLPSPKEDDIDSYIMTVGDETKSVKFYASCSDGEVSILSPGKEEKIYHRRIDETVDYSTKLDSINYYISNTFLSRIEDKTLKAYFAWSLESNEKERLDLEADFYIFGREPLDNLTQRETGDTYRQLVHLNREDDDFWRIGASRDHAILVKSEEDEKHRVFNISLSYPVYVIKAGDLENHVIRPHRIEPVAGEKEEAKLAGFLGLIKDALINRQESSGLPGILQEFAHSMELETNDLVFIGNKVFRYIVPMVMESPLSDMVRKSILRKIQVNKSVIRK